MLDTLTNVRRCDRSGLSAPATTWLWRLKPASLR
jgi:hypothetical protein